MGTTDQSLVARRALERAGVSEPDPVEVAQARLAALLAEVGALDAEVEARSLDLARFAAELERRLAPGDADLHRLASLVRRLRSLAEGLEAERARVSALPSAKGASPRPSRRKKGAGSRPAARSAGFTGDDVAGEADGAASEWGTGGQGDREADTPVEVPTVEALERELKQLYRRLARLLHPDLARTDEERVRLGDLMAKVNAAYAAADRTALELMAEKVGAGEPPGDLTGEERLAHLARRLEQLERVAASLRRERERLLGTETARLWREATRRAEQGGDYFSEEVAALVEEAAAASTDALARLDGAVKAAQALARERRMAMSKLTRDQGGAVARRPFDPLAESALVRRSAARLDLQRAGAGARQLARWLEEAATRQPWEVGLTVLAFLLEAAGDRPPPAVATAAGLAARWELVREGWPDAPALPGALARAPRHLVVGARLGSEEVVAGLQLAEAELHAGVRLALEHGAVAQVARRVLAVLGPAERCRPCRREVLALHLLRTRGLDERHGLICPRCGAVLRSYWRYGEAEGLEALAPLSLSLGLVEEQQVTLAGATLGFQLRPEERAAWTARGLVERFSELYLETYEAPLPRGAVRVGQGSRAGGRLLEPKAPLAGQRGLALRLTPEAGLAEEGLLELLRTRVERRFRPGG